MAISTSATLAHASSAITIESQTQTSPLDPNLLNVLVQFDCLSSLSQNPQEVISKFQTELDSSLRKNAPNHVFALARHMRSWWSLRSYVQSLQTMEGAGVCDLKMTQYILSQVRLDSLFEVNATWSHLSGMSYQAIVTRVALLNEQGDLLKIFSRIFVLQRNSLLKESLLKVLPSFVLFISTLIGLVMAIYVWRSLMVGN